VHEITEENNFKKPVGGLLVPKSMWGISSALVITWINILRINNVLVCLWESRDSGGQFVNIWSNNSSKIVEDWVVEEF